VGVYELLVPMVQVGITDRISVGGGTPLFFGGDGSRPYWVTPKVQVVASETTQAAAGMLYVGRVEVGELGVAYGVLTTGSRDSAVTIGAGYGWDGSGRGTPVAMVGGEHRVSRHVKLITENYAFDGAVIASFGVRFIGDRLSADLGLAVPIASGEVIAFPVVNFVWRFGKD
jgi:hypothetical protein